MMSSDDLIFLYKLSSYNTQISNKHLLTKKLWSEIFLLLKEEIHNLKL